MSANRTNLKNRTTLNKPTTEPNLNHKKNQNNLNHNTTPNIVPLLLNHNT